MSTTQQSLSSKTAAWSPSPAVRLITIVAMLTSVRRVFRNRTEITQLQDLTDTQLCDIGLTRAELHSALHQSAFFEDPSAHLTRSARRRARAGLREGLGS